MGREKERGKKEGRRANRKEGVLRVYGVWRSGRKKSYGGDQGKRSTRT
jgi:hypothetical protein